MCNYGRFHNTLCIKIAQDIYKDHKQIQIQSKKEITVATVIPSTFRRYVPQFVNNYILIINLYQDVYRFFKLEVVSLINGVMKDFMS